MAVGESSPTAGEVVDLSGAWIDRDISWLEFNRRVLHEALDERTPLLERVKFLAIFSANLDEFFMKRMSRLADPTGLAAPAQRELAAQIRAGGLALARAPLPELAPASELVEVELALPWDDEEEEPAKEAASRVAPLIFDVETQRSASEVGRFLPM